jgi:hypothetical protein
MDRRNTLAKGTYQKLKEAMKSVEGQDDMIAGLEITCHTGKFLSSLTPEELANLQASIAFRTMENLREGKG